MLELLVAPNMVDLIPTIVLQPPNHLAAVHKSLYTLNTHLSNGVPVPSRAAQLLDLLDL